MSDVLHVVGLGPGGADHLTLRAWELLASGKPLLVRDRAHEAAQTILARGFAFDTVEEAVHTDPLSLAAQVLEWSRLQAGTAVYAVAGHPLEAPETVPILRGAAAAGLEVEVEPALTDLERLPAEDPLTGAYAGPAAVRGAIALQRLVAVMSRLRAPGGCPWDREQTHGSLAIHLLEETHEVLDAIDRGDMVDLEEELGDLLLQIVFHAELAAEQGAFEIGDVVEELVAKLVYRHPHVFGDVTVSGAGEVVANWEALKHAQKQRASLADGIPLGLPALLFAHKVQRRMAGAGRPHVASSDRLGALAGAVGAGGDEEAIAELLFEAVAAAAAAGVDPEGALRRATNRHLAAAEAEAAAEAKAKT